MSRSLDPGPGAARDRAGPRPRRRTRRGAARAAVECSGGSRVSTPDMSEIDVDAARERNEERAEEEFREGPVVPEPDRAPIGDAIADFWARDGLSLAIPAHRGGAGAVRPDAAAWLGDTVFRADLGMDKGVDDRHLVGNA